MPKFDYKFAILGFLLVVTMTISAFNLFRPNPRVGYISNVDVYNDFSLKKQLETKLTQAQTVQKEYLDSLYIKIQSGDKTINSQAASDYYFSKKQQFEEANHSLSEEYNKQIWTRLNQYIEEYGRKYNYTLIMGATGNGTLMYGDSTYDITNDVKQYIAGRYKGDIQ